MSLRLGLRFALWLLDLIVLYFVKSFGKFLNIVNLTSNVHSKFIASKIDVMNALCLGKPFGETCFIDLFIYRLLRNSSEYQRYEWSYHQS